MHRVLADLWDWRTASTDDIEAAVDSLLDDVAAEENAWRLERAEALAVLSHELRRRTEAATE